MDELGRTVQMREQGQVDAALAVIKGDAGRQLMVQIRGLVMSMDQSERDMLHRRTAAVDTQRFLLMIAIMLAVGLASALAYMVIREGQRHAAELRRSLAQLEQEVRQREDVEAQLVM